MKHEISNKNSVLRILEADGRQIESVTLTIIKLTLETIFSFKECLICRKIAVMKSTKLKLKKKSCQNEKINIWNLNWSRDRG